MEAAAAMALGESATPKQLREIVAEILNRTTTAYPPSPHHLACLVHALDAFDNLWRIREKRPHVAEIITSAPIFAPVARLRDIGVPALTTTAALAEWLTLPFPLVQWLADIEGFRTRRCAAGHYNHTWIPKRIGPPRLIESPKSILKCVQRQILHEILDRVPLHDCVHGFRTAHSCVSAAQHHAGENIVVAVDLKDFFLRVPLRRVHGLFRSLGYPWAVARLLTALCSTTTSDDILASLPPGNALEHETYTLFRQRHLPQGAPTSPALANMCSRELDCRLSGLSKRFGARYTRYGDDLAFSGDEALAQRVDSFVSLVGQICTDTGLHLNRRKTRIMRRGARQRLLGLVVNQHVNIPRDRYERLKATLHNCVRHGPESQNRDHHPNFRAHLDGQITWVENVNLRKGHRLRLTFQRIDWS